jgi:hypothetical protein
MTLLPLLPASLDTPTPRTSTVSSAPSAPRPGTSSSRSTEIVITHLGLPTRPRSLRASAPSAIIVRLQTLPHFHRLLFRTSLYYIPQSKHQTRDCIVIMANLSNIRKEILEIDIARPMAPTHVSFLFEPPLPISHFNELIRGIGSRPNTYGSWV